MFHVKPKFWPRFFSKILITILIAVLSVSCYSQKEKDFAIGLGSELSFGGGYNNLAASVRLSYNLLDRVRVVPAYSLFLKKGKQNMNSISFDFNYLLPNVSPKIFSTYDKGVIVIYPIAGFYIINYSNLEKNCEACSAGFSNPGASSQINFGFNIGAGGEYKLPVTSKLFSKTSFFFEMKGIIIEKYSRPLFSLGLLYKI